jgi:hypothetical protein
MALGIVSGFTATRIVTSVATTVKTGVGAHYVVARLYNASASAVNMSIHNGADTSAATRVAWLYAPATSLDELGVPIRCPDGVKVKMSAYTADSIEGFVYVR